MFGLESGRAAAGPQFGLKPLSRIKMVLLRERRTEPGLTDDLADKRQIERRAAGRLDHRQIGTGGARKQHKISRGAETIATLRREIVKCFRAVEENMLAAERHEIVPVGPLPLIQLSREDDQVGVSREEFSQRRLRIRQMLEDFKSRDQLRRFRAERRYLEIIGIFRIVVRIVVEILVALIAHEARQEASRSAVIDAFGRSIKADEREEETQPEPS